MPKKTIQHSKFSVRCSAFFFLLLTLSLLAPQKAAAIMDPDTGLIMYRHRHYSPDLGRFISRDPIAEQGGTNLYAYVRNNPLNAWDWLGLDPRDEFGTPQEALADARAYLRKKGNESVAKGWQDFKATFGVGRSNLFDDPMSWYGKLKEDNGTDHRVFLLKNGPNGKPIWQAIIGREKAAAVYCYRKSATETKFSYNYDDGSVVTAKEYRKKPRLGRVPEEVIDKLWQETHHAPGHPIIKKYWFLHTHILEGFSFSYYGQRPRMANPRHGLSDSDISASQKKNIPIIAIEDDGNDYYDDGKLKRGKTKGVAPPEPQGR